MENVPQTLDDWLTLIEARHGQQIELGLDRVKAVRDALALHLTPLTTFTVGGTNGKGSTCAMLESILLAAGYSVGKYTSPHLLRYVERISINGAPIDEGVLAQAFEAVENARGDIPLTYFEHGTLAAWVCFMKAGVNALVWEVGLGGRLDAVNIFDSDCAIVTSVDLDHMDYLGNTVEAIAFEKAGIFRPGCPAICAQPNPPQTLVEYAHQIGAKLQIIGEDFGYMGQVGGQAQWTFWSDRGTKRRSGLAYPALRGAYQLQNACAVMAALQAVGQKLPVSMQAIRQGFMTVSLPGRFQVWPGLPTVILDVGHNPHAARALAGTLAVMPYAGRTFAVFGMLGDKDIETVVQTLLPRVTDWFPVALSGPRGLTSAALIERMQAAGVVAPLSGYISPQAGFFAAQKAAVKDDRIVVFGSFLTVAGVLSELLNKV